MRAKPVLLRGTVPIRRRRAGCDKKVHYATDVPKQVEPAQAPVSRERVKTLTIAALAAIALLNIADIVTTHLLLSRKAVESNPFASGLLGYGELTWVKLAMVGLALLLGLRLRPRVGVLVLAWFVAGIYGAAVLSNALILRVA